MKNKTFLPYILFSMMLFPLYTSCRNDNDTIEIMPLGDSLTEADQPGYRGYLYQKLTASGFRVNFTGVKKSTPANGGDPRHSGFNGYTIGPGPSDGDSWESSRGHANIYWHLDQGYHILDVPADIILLMIGTNDFANTKSDYDPEKEGAVRLGNLIEKIYSLRPEVTLLVSTLTPVAADPEYYASKFNRDIPDIVREQQEKGHKCYTVDTRHQHAWNIKTDIGPDGLHLSPSGYEKVAESFYTVLSEILTQ